eukprot:GHRR01011385.1.p2 GENE.GHRR01011385.1~~GHRR01011385.1.p2  ORF type:complete len:112 (-),score=19.64 GHRR01011385.1:1365-1700(-)
MATSGDHLRIWNIKDNGVTLDRLLTSVSLGVAAPESCIEHQQSQALLSPMQLQWRISMVCKDAAVLKANIQLWHASVVPGPHYWHHAHFGGPSARFGASLRLHHLILYYAA